MGSEPHLLHRHLPCGCEQLNKRVTICSRTQKYHWRDHGSLASVEVKDIQDAMAGNRHTTCPFFSWSVAHFASIALESWAMFRSLEEAIFNRLETTVDFVSVYKGIHDRVFRKYPLAHPIEQQYILETMLWKKYISPIDNRFNLFRCPDPRPYLEGSQPAQCANCVRHSHW